MLARAGTMATWSAIVGQRHVVLSELAAVWNGSQQSCKLARVDMRSLESVLRLECAQAHGQKTAYAFMLDADFEVVDGWRLRHTVHRLVTECRERSIPECMKGIKVSPLSPSPHMDDPSSVRM